MTGFVFADAVMRIVSLTKLTELAERENGEMVGRRYKVRLADVGEQVYDGDTIKDVIIRLPITTTKRRMKGIPR